MKKTASLLAVLLLAVLLTACGGSDTNAALPDPGAPEMEKSEEGTAADSVYDQSHAVGSEIETTRKLIYNAHISAETKDFEGAKSSLDGLIVEFGGYLESSDISGSSYGNSRGSRSLDYTIRIPAASLKDFLSGVGEVVNVVSNTMDMEDVTDSYIDTDAHLQAMKQEEERLLELLDQAASLDEILMIEDRLSQVRYEIDSLTGRLKAYDNEIEYSTVTFYLRDVTEYSSSATFSSRISEAFSGGWNNFVKALQSILLLLIWALPFLVAAAVVVVLIVLPVRRASKKKKAKFGQYVQPPVPPQRQDPPPPKTP